METKNFNENYIKWLKELQSISIENKSDFDLIMEKLCSTNDALEDLINILEEKENLNNTELNQDIELYKSIKNDIEDTINELDENDFNKSKEIIDDLLIPFN